MPPRVKDGEETDLGSLSHHSTLQTPRVSAALVPASNRPYRRSRQILAILLRPWTFNPHSTKHRAGGFVQPVFSSPPRIATVSLSRHEPVIRVAKLKTLFFMMANAKSLILQELSSHYKMAPDSVVATRKTAGQPSVFAKRSLTSDAQPADIFLRDKPRLPAQSCMIDCSLTPAVTVRPSVSRPAARTVF